MNQQEKQQNYERAEKLLSEQNFTAALIVGAVAMILAAAFYAIAANTFRFSYGFAIAGIGIAVGAAMQFLGRGISTKFAVAAAIYTIAGCLLGNVFRAVGFPRIDGFQTETISTLVGQSFSYFSLIDLVYWFVAVFAAVFLAKRPLSRADGLAIHTYARNN